MLRDLLAPTGRPAELGRLAHATVEAQRARRAWRGYVRREMLRGARWAVPLGVLLGALVGDAVAQASSVVVGVSCGFVVLAGCAALPRRRVSGLDGQVRAFDAWAAAWEQAGTALRAGLDRAWTICWDRRLGGWSEPLTLAVGPSGLWALVVVPPGRRAEADRLLRLLVDHVAPAGVQVEVRCLSAAAGARAWRALAAQMVCARFSCPPGERRRVLDRIEATLVEDPAVLATLAGG